MELCAAAVCGRADPSAGVTESANQLDTKAGACNHCGAHGVTRPTVHLGKAASAITGDGSLVARLSEPAGTRELLRESRIRNASYRYGVGRGCGVGCARGVGITLGVAVGVALGVADGVAVGVALGLAVGVGVGVPPAHGGIS